MKKSKEILAFEKLANVTLSYLDGKWSYGGSLYLRGTGITSLPDNLTVGGSLYLRGTGITSLPDNLTVGGSLYLRGTGITSLPDNLTVGGSLYLRGTGITSHNVPQPEEGYVFSWQNGKYILADGVLTEVLSKRGNVHKVIKVGSKKEGYLITDGKGKFAHGDTVKEAKEDLIYKITNRDTSKYKSLITESILAFKDAIECYRTITGACSAGTRQFVESKIGRPKSSYTISEIIEMTNGNYGAESFANFFKK
jgi:hypothetical protein